MKKIKVVLSWILALMMMTTLLTGFQTVSAAALDDIGIEFDDAGVTATATGTNAYTVKLPDGRPRIPQITCDGATVVQAFIADNETEGTATVVKDGVTYTITFVKDASLGFVLQYDDHYTWKSGLTGTVTYSSNNSNVASVNSTTGEIVVKAVSNNGATITATNGSTTKTLVITKTIKAVVGVWLLTGQSNTSYHYNNKFGGIGVENQPGTVYYSGALVNGEASKIQTKMTAMNGTTTGGMEPEMAKTFYDKTGEKVYIMSAGISGTGVSHFLPGNYTTFDTGSGTWALINTVYENFVAESSTADFQSKYETRMRSYFYLQGCAEVGSHWSVHYNGLAVTKNTKTFTTAGKTYPIGSHTFLTYMTDVLGFDACMDIMVGWRPVGITASTRTAQFKMAEDFDDYVIASRLIQTMSEADGTYRGDALHINQEGKNIIGYHSGGYAVRFYQGGVLQEAATGATAFFNKIGYKDGDTVYVQPGDFYNYCTRPDNLTSDDQFAYKFSGADVIEYDGQNEFVVKADAAPGSTATMEIYSEGDLDTPITTLTVQVIGERADGYTAVNSETYKWIFDSNNNPVTMEGNITLNPAAGFEGKSTLEMSRDLMLDSDGYWSIEWKGNGVGNGSMLASSSNAYSKATLGDMIPNFFYIYHTNAAGWQVFRDTAFTDNFWRGYTGNAITGEHVFKVECRNNVYTFSVDGKVLDSREIVEGHGSNYANSTNPTASSGNMGKFDNVFNIHYLLGGINGNGINSTKYGYDGKVEYIKISIGDEKAEITRVNNYPYAPASGAGTQDDPYIINANVAAGTVINESSFMVNAPLGTATFSTEKFGGEAFTSFTCNSGTKSVYAMVLGALPYMSTFYKINFTVSDNPDVMYYEVMADATVFNLADGATKSYTIDGNEVTFIKGKSLFDNINDAIRLVAEDGVVYVAAGEYAENVEVSRDIVIKGAQAGVDPNVKGANATDPWTNARMNVANETVITGDWSIVDGSEHFELDGVTLTKGATITDDREIDNVHTDFYLNNIIVDGVTTDKALTFGEVATTQTGAIKGGLYVTNMRTQNLTKAALFNTALDHVAYSNSYFHGGSRLDAYRVPGVNDGTTDNVADYVVTNCMFVGADRAAAVQLNLAPTATNKNIDAYAQVDVIFDGNIFLNTIYSSASLENGVIQLTADTDVFSFTFENNLVYEGADSNANAETAFIYAVGNANGAATAGNYFNAYAINDNKFIADAANGLPAIFSSVTGSKGHSNVNVGGNYSEMAGAAVAPVTNEATNTTTQKPISYSKYHYLDPDFTSSTCDHTEIRLDRQPASCVAEGYENTICASCDEIIVENIIPRIDHIRTDWTVDAPATCTKDGRQIISCTICRNVLESEIIPATGHNDGKWKVTQDATCAAAGVRSKICTACMEAIETEEIAVLEHAYVVINTTDSTCTALGTNVLECTACHNITNETVPLKLHTPGAWETKRPANCYNEGEKVIRCTECKQIMSSEIIPVTHNLEWIEIIPADDMGFGIEGLICTVCGHEEDYRIIEPEYRDATDKFEDIGTNDWYVKNGAIDFVYTLGLFEGTSDTTFSPNAAMTRAMFVTVLGRLSGVVVNNNITTRFDDVKKGMWYTGYVAWAADNKIVDGTSYFTFAPNAPITREQIAKIIVNYCDFDPFFELIEVEKYQKFADDAKISSWAKEYVKACQMADVINGKSGNIFDPQGNATRAEVATILMNLFLANVNA